MIGVDKEKYKDQLVIFEQLIIYKFFDLNVDGLGDFAKQVSLITLNLENWRSNTCTCKYFGKK